MNPNGPLWPIQRAGSHSGQPVADDVDAELLEAARLQGRLWGRVGADVSRKLRQHSPHWGSCLRQRMKLVAACLAGVKEGRSA
jgi:hypothetical protein